MRQMLRDEPALNCRSNSTYAALPHSPKLSFVLLRSEHPAKTVAMRDEAAVRACGEHTL